MNILFVSDCYPTNELPQYCVFLEQQAKALIALGANVDVLMPTTENTQSFYKDGIKVTTLWIPKGTKKDLFLRTELDKSIKEELSRIVSGYDIVAVHFCTAKVLRTVINVCNKRGVKVVGHFHGLNIWHEETSKHKALEKLLTEYKKIDCKKLSAVVGVSEKVTAEFKKEIGFLPSFTVYNGVNTELFPFTERKELRYPIRIICSANLIEIKGHRYLFDAVAKLKSKGYTVNLSICGRGPLEDELKTLAKELSIENEVNFLGYLTYTELAEKTAKNDIFIMPSYYEALGCVYLEAMSAGLITVGVKGEGIDEIIKDGKNGFLVLPKDSDTIVKTVEKICKLTTEELSSLCENARASAESFTWQNSAEKLLKCYNEIKG